MNREYTLTQAYKDRRLVQAVESQSGMDIEDTFADTSKKAGILKNVCGYMGLRRASDRERNPFMRFEDMDFSNPHFAAQIGKVIRSQYKSARKRLEEHNLIG